MAAGDPTGADLASVTFTTEDLTFNENVWTVFTFDSPTTLIINRRYAIVVGSDDAILSDDLAWQQDTAAGYAGGLKCVSSDSGVTWSQSPTRDCVFRLNSASGQEQAFEVEDAKQAIYSPFYAAQTFTADSTFDIISVGLKLNIESIAPTRTVTISIRAVESGKATTPTPTDNQEDIEITGKDNLRQLTWDAPVDETPDYLVYFRAEGGSWVLQETITDDSTSHTMSAALRASLRYYSVYEWRVDTLNAGSTTTGDTWTFISQVSPDFTDYSRKSDYDADKVWQPGTGWVDPNTFEFTGGGSYKEQVVVVGHKVIYFGDL